MDDRRRVQLEAPNSRAWRRASLNTPIHRGVLEARMPAELFLTVWLLSLGKTVETLRCREGAEHLTEVRFSLR